MRDDVEHRYLLIFCVPNLHLVDENSDDSKTAAFTFDSL